MTLRAPLAWFYALFTLSGVAGLIYESIWSHYLKLFLGHAAYAQTLVLAIFMGGMAVGSWVCSRKSVHWKNLLLAYAVAEALVGVFSLGFHRLFVETTGLAYDTIMPELASPAAVGALKLAICTLLILPQSVLLGATFPLMSAGLIRAYPGEAGSTVAMLYFTNSLGAAVGVLASGFALIPLLGLPGTLLTAGLLNIAIALVVWLTAGDMKFEAPSHSRKGNGTPNAGNFNVMLMVALLTGAASFVYEIGWIRMLSMVLGTTTHAFELMLSAFVLGLAFGGLWIKRRIEYIRRPESFLGIVQVLMGLLALATLAVYGSTFEIMQWLLDAVARTESGYAMFNLGSHLIAMVVMFPATFCAGMTLPLVTHSLMRKGAGERAIGAVYAANTVGAILGVIVAVHIGMPALGLKGLISAGAIVDIGLGLFLLWWTARLNRLFVYASVAGVMGLVATLALVDLDPYKMASGVYRHGALLNRRNTEIVYHQDGKTATVNLVKSPELVSIHTNGKSDAALNPDINGPMTPDETTMILTAALPLALLPQAQTVANIGFGSGLTSHVALSSETVRQVDTIEIESAMVDAAHGFAPRNDNVYRDPRSRIYLEDARTFFSTHNSRYDVIISEPSNPWVSGVASLFTEEFYQRIKRHLNDDGLFVQWIQIYEISPELIASVFGALDRHFTDYVVFAPYDFDIIIVARNGAPVPAFSDAIFKQPRLARELERIQIRSAADLELHRVGNKRGMQPYFDAFRTPVNSDFFPVLDLNAAKSRFLGAKAVEIVDLALTPVPALEILGKAAPPRRAADVPRPWLRRSEHRRQALAARDYVTGGKAERLATVSRALRSDIELVRLNIEDCRPAGRQSLSVDSLLALAGATVPYLTVEEQGTIWGSMRASPCASRLDSNETEWLALLMAISARDAGKMAQLAESLLRKQRAENYGHRDYLLGAAVTGHLAIGKRDSAEALWTEFTAHVVTDRRNVLPHLLRGHLFAAGRHRQIR